MRAEVVVPLRNGVGYWRVFSKDREYLVSVRRGVWACECMDFVVRVMGGLKGACKHIVFIRN